MHKREQLVVLGEAGEKLKQEIKKEVVDFFITDVANYLISSISIHEMTKPKSVASEIHRLITAVKMLSSLPKMEGEQYRISVKGLDLALNYDDLNRIVAKFYAKQIERLTLNIKEIIYVLDTPCQECERIAAEESSYDPIMSELVPEIMRMFNGRYEG